MLVLLFLVNSFFLNNVDFICVDSIIFSEEVNVILEDYKILTGEDYPILVIEHAIIKDTSSIYVIYPSLSVKELLTKPTSYTLFKNFQILCYHDSISEKMRLDTNCIKVRFEKALTFLRITSFQVYSWNEYVFFDDFGVYFFDPLVVRYSFYNDKMVKSLNAGPIYKSRLKPKVYY